MIGQVLPKLRTARTPFNVIKSSFQQKKGRFKNLKLLGEGFFAKAYSATLDGRKVIIKVIVPRTGVHDDAFLESIRREARIMGRLQKYPFVPRLIEVGIDYYVQEDVGGDSLERLVLKKGLTPHEVLSTAVSVAVIVGLFADDGIVHSDLKADNILLTPGGIVIIDFGVAWEEGGEPPAIAFGGVKNYKQALAQDVRLILGLVVTVARSDVPPDIRDALFGIRKKYVGLIVTGKVDKETPDELARDLMFITAQLGARARRSASLKKKSIRSVIMFG